MTEEQWLETNTALHMVAYLADREGDRKLRLFACAACRRIWRVMQYEASHRAVEISERYADGQANGKELRLVENEADELADSSEQLRIPGWNAARAAAFAASESGRAAAERAAMLAADPDLVREHFGNPFRSVTISADILSWHDKTVVRLAQAAYDERILPAGTLTNARLLILADALEEAGCTDEQILTHLRSDDRHYRGCWGIDLLLGRR